MCICMVLQSIGFLIVLFCVFVGCSGASLVFLFLFRIHPCPIKSLKWGSFSWELILERKTFLKTRVKCVYFLEQFEDPMVFSSELSGIRKFVLFACGPLYNFQRTVNKLSGFWLKNQGKITFVTMEFYPILKSNPTFLFSSI